MTCSQKTGSDSTRAAGGPFSGSWHPQEFTEDAGPAKNCSLASKNSPLHRKTQLPPPWPFQSLSVLFKNVPGCIRRKGLKASSSVYLPFYLGPSLWVSWSSKTQELTLRTNDLRKYLEPGSLCPRSITPNQQKQKPAPKAGKLQRAGMRPCIDSLFSLKFLSQCSLYTVVEFLDCSACLDNSLTTGKQQLHVRTCRQSGPHAIP